jgi:hypothetical protein
MADMRNDACRSLTLHREKRKRDSLVLIALSRRKWRGKCRRRAERDGGDCGHRSS